LVNLVILFYFIFLVVNGRVKLIEFIFERVIDKDKAY
jgi:hypothetical protein